MRSKTHPLKLALSLGLRLLFLFPLTIVRASLLTNDGFNNPYSDIPGRTFGGNPQKIASGWTPFYIDSGTYDANDEASKLRWMSSAQFASAFGGIDYRLEGDQSQSMWSSYDMNAGVYQQVSGLTPGQDYGFDIAIVTYWRGPGYPTSNGQMVRQVGIDPAGGIDPTSSDVIWSETDAQDKKWVYMDIAATAISETVTIYAKVQAPDNNSTNHVDLNMVYFDAAYMDLAPTLNLNTSVNGTNIAVSWSGGANSDWSLKGYEVQYKAQSASSWTTLQAKNNKGTSANFVGQSGTSYQVRARAWQTRIEGYNSDIDMPGVWQYMTVVPGGGVLGTVTTNQAHPLGGATVTVTGTATSTTSSVDGSYILATGAGTFGVVAMMDNGWSSLEPVKATPYLTAADVLTLTLSPPDNFVQNGGFAGNLSNWINAFSQPGFDSQTNRSGDHSLVISETGSLSQNGVVANMYRPVLSFWYKVGSGDGDDSLQVEIAGAGGLPATGPLTVSNVMGDWQHVSLPLVLSGTEVYSGNLSVQFSTNQVGGTPTLFYLDEVSFGSSWGGTQKIYLPIVARN